MSTPIITQPMSPGTAVYTIVNGHKVIIATIQFAMMEYDADGATHWEYSLTGWTGTFRDADLFGDDMHGLRCVIRELAKRLDKAVKP